MITTEQIIFLLNPNIHIPQAKSEPNPRAYDMRDKGYRSMQRVLQAVESGLTTSRLIASETGLSKKHVQHYLALLYKEGAVKREEVRLGRNSIYFYQGLTQ